MASELNRLATSLKLPSTDSFNIANNREQKIISEQNPTPTNSRHFVHSSLNTRVARNTVSQQDALQRANSRSTLSSEEDAIINVSETECARGPLILPAPVIFTPPARSESLPSYCPRINEYNNEKHKNQLQPFIRQHGYNNVEDFLKSSPNDAAKAAASRLRNPADEARDSLRSGGIQEIMRYVTQTTQDYKRRIDEESCPERKQALLKGFLTEIKGNWNSWMEFLQQDTETLRRTFNRHLDDIRFQKPNRWIGDREETWTEALSRNILAVRKTAWTYSGDESRWNREWNAPNGRLMYAKQAVKTRLEAGRDELIAELKLQVNNAEQLLSTAVNA